jgi:hypothetical protein
MSNTLWPAPVIVLGYKIPHELDALKRKAIRRRYLLNLKYLN